MKDGSCFMSVAQTSVALASGRLSADEIMEQLLTRVAARDEQVQAWSWLDPAQAQARARQAAEEIRQGVRHSPLQGIPVAVKDLIDTEGMLTTYGSPIYKDHHPTSDAAIVTALKKAGAYVMGKTVSTEFACFTAGPTMNPHNPEYSPGGSSSGSAAAVADGQVPFAIGTQTAGSVIRPAAFNGVVGLKPSYGVLPTAGTFPLCPTLDTLGTFSRTVGDQRLILTALAPHLPIANAVKNPKILVCKTPFWSQGDDEMHTAFDQFVADCQQAGADLEHYEMGPDFAALLTAQQQIMGVEASRALSTHYDQQRDQLSAPLVALIEQGMQVNNADEAAAHNLKARCAHKLQQLFRDADFIITPATAGTAPKRVDGTGDPLFNRIWTLLGLPAITFPIAQGGNGLPLGIQLVAPLGEDHALIDFADKLQTLTRA